MTYDQWKTTDPREYERDLAYDRIIELEKALAGAQPQTTQEPIAYLHTLHMELGQTQRKLTFTESSPFGIPAKHYSEEYTVSCTSLYAHPRPDGGGG